MDINRKVTWPILFIISSLCLSANLDFCSAITPEHYEDGTSPTEDGWTTYDGELVGVGHSWAGYDKSCEEGPLTLKFKLKSLVGGMHANINVNGPDRYAVGFNNTKDGLLSTYIFKQVGEIIPSPIVRFPGEPLIYNQTREYQVDILSDNGHVQVFVYEPDQELGAQLPVLDYRDPDPLPPGRIDFETLNGSLVHLSNVSVICPSPTIDGEIQSNESEETPDLGAIYFERPDPSFLV